MTDMRAIEALRAGTLTRAAAPGRTAASPVFVWALAAVTLVALAAGFALAAGPASEAAVRAAGPELTRLLRAMAALKLAMAGLGVWLASLRLRLPVSPGRAGGYIGAAAAMAVAPGLIWGMAYVVAGALLLHGGMVALALVAWTDRGTGPALNAWIARKRAAAIPR